MRGIIDNFSWMTSTVIAAETGKVTISLERTMMVQWIDDRQKSYTTKNLCSYIRPTSILFLASRRNN